MLLGWGLIALFAAVVAVGGFNILHTRKHGFRDREDKWSHYAEVAGLIAITVALSFSLITIGPRFARIGGLVSTPAGFVILGLTCGVVLFVIRGWRKDVYGMLEIATAVFTLVFIGLRYDPSQYLATALAFMSAVYVLVRGLTNYSEGRS